MTRKEMWKMENKRWDARKVSLFENRRSFFLAQNATFNDSVFDKSAIENVYQNGVV